MESVVSGNTAMGEIEYPETLRQQSERILRDPSCSAQTIIENFFGLIFRSLILGIRLHHVLRESEGFVTHDDVAATLYQILAVPSPWEN